MSKWQFHSPVQSEMLLRKRVSILNKSCFKYEQLFLPVQCTACVICQSNSTDNLVWPKKTGFLSTTDQLQYLWGTNCFGNGTRQYPTCLCQSWSLNTFFATILFCPVCAKKIYIGSVLSMSGNHCTSTTVSVSFAGSFFAVTSTTL